MEWSSVTPWSPPTIETTGYTGLLVLQKVQGAQSEVELFYSTILESVKCELKWKVMYTLSFDCSVARLRLVVAELAMKGSRTIAK
jgi:hypothetical protein